MSAERTYLGDAVSVEVERGMVKLTTSDGLRDTNVVYMEREVLAAFERWLSAMRQNGGRS